MRAVFFHRSATEPARRDFLHLVLVSCEDIIGELLAEKILGYCGHTLILFKSSVDL